MMHMPGGSGTKLDDLDRQFQKKYYPIPTKDDKKELQDFYVNWIKMMLKRKLDKLERKRKNAPGYIQPGYQPHPRNPYIKIA